MSKAVLSLSDIQRIAAENLSRFEGEEQFEGDPDNYEGEMYEGNGFDGDDFVNYDGVNLAKNGSQTFSISITNANAAQRIALISPGIVRTTTGCIATGAFNDKNGSAGLTGSATPGSIEQFIEFMRRNPVRINTIQVVSTDPTQLYQTVIVQQESPFRVLEQKLINLGSHVSPGDFKDKMSIIPANQYGWQFDDQTRIEFPVTGSSTLTLTFYIGPIMNSALAMDRKYKRAVAGVVRRRPAPKKK